MDTEGRAVDATRERSCRPRRESLPKQAVLFWTPVWSARRAEPRDAPLRDWVARKRRCPSVDHLSFYRSAGLCVGFVCPSLSRMHARRARRVLRSAVARSNTRREACTSTQVEMSVSPWGQACRRALVSFCVAALALGSAGIAVAAGPAMVQQMEAAPAVIPKTADLVGANRATALETVQMIRAFFFDQAGGLHFDEQLFHDLGSRLVSHELDQAFLTSQAQAHAFLKDVVKTLHDPYSAYLDQEEFQTLMNPQRSRTHSISGVGLQLDLRRAGDVKSLGGWAVLGPVPASPAEIGGISIGERLVAVDGTAVVDLSSDEVAALLRGEPGTRVTLTMALGNSREGLREVTLTRSRLHAPPVRAEIFDSIDERTGKSTRLGYVRIHYFNHKSTDMLAEALQTFASSKVQGVILDLRNNSGGVFQEALRMGTMFFDEGDTVLVITEDSNGVLQEHTVEGQKCDTPFGPLLARTPVVVLTNGASASSSEILAVSLRDNDRAPIIGLPTFGKGLVQHIFQLPDGSALRLTIAQVLSPRLAHVNGRGALPDSLCADSPNFEHRDRCIQDAARVLTYSAPTYANAQPQIIHLSRLTNVIGGMKYPDP
ncbi:Carboxyl-terminal-processing protease [Porphyridium purpureum]|uniref:Carboxyl-terminal-processing protease n=1 Tax=Porphyridium purpureum TaxID=35688 RepID=A0A5J4YR75_PORPP|nr:Carboxyl-terminal-processing protease [Porphyridium purpureum]|eukprot:POR9524..scf236_6